jgi:hypothetical protein
MSDDVHDTDTSISQEVPSEGDDEISGDPLLNLLVHLAEKGAGSSITLYSSGLIVTGVLCSRREYFEASKSKFDRGVFPILFSEMLSVLDEEPKEDGPAPDYNYVHLVGGQVIAPGQFGIPNGGVPMRIRRSEVIGWSMGQLAASRD